MQAHNMGLSALVDIGLKDSMGINYPLISIPWALHKELVPNDFSLVVLHTESVISFYLWCILGGSVRI
jgi:hypothetical protein